MIGPALPRAFGCQRLSRGPSFATASFTRSNAGSSLWLFGSVAFAIADFNVFSIIRADLRGMTRNTSSALEALKPWIKRVTSPTFDGLMRAYFVIALTSIKLLSQALRHPRDVSHLESDSLLHPLDQRATNSLAHFDYSQLSHDAIAMQYDHRHPHPGSLEQPDIQHYDPKIRIHVQNRR
jgi:hypothetical protein